jgi:predicted TIM-barrel fold metal-dependent hydrolase
MSASLQTPLPALNDREGAVIPESFPEVIDAHVHLFPDEFDAYRRLLDDYDNLWLDTTMTLANYLPFNDLPHLAGMRRDRLIYGSDFPNLPYAWDRELRRISRLDLTKERLSKLLHQNAIEFYSINSGKM